MEERLDSSGLLQWGLWKWKSNFPGYFCSSEAKLLLLIIARSPQQRSWSKCEIQCFDFFIEVLEGLKTSASLLLINVLERSPNFSSRIVCFDFWVFHLALIIHTGLIKLLVKNVFYPKLSQWKQFQHSPLHYTGEEERGFLLLRNKKISETWEQNCRIPLLADSNQMCNCQIYSRVPVHYTKVFLVMLHCCTYWTSWSSYISIGTCELAHREHFFSDLCF